MDDFQDDCCAVGPDKPWLDDSVDAVDADRLALKAIPAAAAAAAALIPAGAWFALQASPRRGLATSLAAIAAAPVAAHLRRRGLDRYFWGPHGFQATMSTLVDADE